MTVIENDTLHVATCPLGSCNWRSSPAPLRGAVDEELRAHLAGHTHADVVEFIWQGCVGKVVTTYRREDTIDD